MRKKVDARLRTLLENGVASRERSLLLLVGDNGREQLVNLHYMLSKASVRARPSVLWCYKKELGFTTHRSETPLHLSAPSSTPVAPFPSRSSGSLSLSPLASLTFSLSQSLTHSLSLSL